MEHYKFFQNRDCEYWRCHNSVPEEEFNCLFCYCPLLTQKACIGIRNGNAKYLINGWKDCSNCDFPHKVENYSSMIDEIKSFHKERK